MLQTRKASPEIVLLETPPTAFTQRERTPGPSRSVHDTPLQPSSRNDTSVMEVDLTEDERAASSPQGGIIARSYSPSVLNPMELESDDDMPAQTVARTSATISEDVAAMQVDVDHMHIATPTPALTRIEYAPTWVADWIATSENNVRRRYMNQTQRKRPRKLNATLVKPSVHASLNFGFGKEYIEYKNNYSFGNILSVPK